MTLICKGEFEKAKNLIKLRMENIKSSIKPELQNLDSGILLQFFENWEDSIENFNGQRVKFKKRIFDILNDQKIHDVTMYYTDNLNVLDFKLEHNVLYINLDGSFDFIINNEIIHMKPFSVASFEKGTKLGIQNYDDHNYLICVKFESSLF